jgi:hypothetical protein
MLPVAAQIHFELFFGLLFYHPFFQFIFNIKKFFFPIALSENDGWLQKINSLGNYTKMVLLNKN